METLNNKSLWVTTVTGNNDPLFFMLGPCVIESEKHALFMAEQLCMLAEKLGFKFIFKSSLDKANRTSLENFRGIGFDAGLRVLENVKSSFGIPVVTDIHDTVHIDEVTSVVDVLQIPAFLCRQTDLLIAAGKTGKIINIKKGQFVAAETMEAVAAKVTSTGNQNVWLCERGYTFGYNNLIVDYRNFPIMKCCEKPIIFDATHSVQRPSNQGSCSGGDRQFVPALAAAAVVQGVAGVFMEVHDKPETALCDGPNSVRLSQLENLLTYLIELDAWTKSHTAPILS